MDDLFADRTISEQTLGRADIAPLVGGLPHHLVDCDLDEADLSGLDLSRWTFERCQLRRTDLTGAKLDGSRWMSCRGGFATFAGADLREAALTACDFNNGAFRRAKLFGSKFERCKLTGADHSPTVNVVLVSGFASLPLMTSPPVPSPPQRH